MKENVKVRSGGENARIPSVFRKEDSRESEMRASDAVQSWDAVAASQCHVLFVPGQTERTCPPLLREVAPQCCWVQEWKIVSHLYWFLISVWFCLFKWMKMMCYCYVAMPEEKFHQRLQKCFWDCAHFMWFYFPPFSFLLHPPIFFFYYALCWWINIVPWKVNLETVQARRRGSLPRQSDGGGD